MFGMGHWELLIVAGVILLLFGHRLPSIMRSMGAGISQFKRGLSDEVEDHSEPAEGAKAETKAAE